MPSFLVEGYVATPTRAALEALVRRARSLEAGGSILYLGSLLLLDDEVCFHVFQAPSTTALAAASERFAFDHDRVVEVVWIPASVGPERLGVGLERT